MASLDFSRACWRCAHSAGFAHGEASHSCCSRLNACPIQAASATGCAYWEAGPGDALPRGWHPVDFKLWGGARIYSTPTPPRAASAQQERPSQPCDHFAFDQKRVATAWRLTGELLNRAQHG